MFSYLLSVLGLVSTFQKTKCKKLLNTTMERIKVLENRRQARLRQLRRDVIELWKLGKEDKVQPWIGRIWKELCLYLVYSKIKDYCAFVQINLKGIAAGQRQCPSALEEPLAGLCFAASCRADLPELQELREIFAMRYGKQIVSSDKPAANCHVNQEFFDSLCAKEPSEGEKQKLLEEIIAQYNIVKQGHEQVTGHDPLSIELGLVDAGTQEAIGDIIKVSEVEDRSEKEVDVLVQVQESNHIETVICEEDSGPRELANELANRKRSLEDRPETYCRTAFKKTYRRKKAVEEEENTSGEKLHEKSTGEGIPTHMHRNEDVLPCNEEISAFAHEYLHAEQAVLYCSQPPRRPPPPPPPPKRALPPVQVSMQYMPFASSHNITSLPLRCSTMANNYTYGSHVHPRLPTYEDLPVRVANFTAQRH